MLTEDLPVFINPLLPEYHVSPYPFFEKQRAHAPILWNPIFMGWVCVDYALTNEVLQSANFSSDRSGSLFERLDADTIREIAPLRKIMKEWALMADPPYHTSLRGIMTQAFAPKVVRGFEARIEKLVDELLSPLEGEAAFDFVKDFAYPLPATVIADILGLPRERTAWFEQLSKDIISVFNLGSRPEPSIAHAAQNALFELNDYFNELLDGRAGPHPEDSMLQVLSEMEQTQDSLTRSEVLSMISLLLVAGHETTRNLLANGLLCLVERPEVYQQLRLHPELLPGAIEEMLRFESPVQLTSRNALEDCTLGGVEIKQGQRVMLCMGAANRDPAVFREPDRFDITRSPNRHVAFGFGRHFCVGAMLARLEAKVAFMQILQRFPKLKLANQTHWGSDASFRCVQELRVMQA